MGGRASPPQRVTRSRAAAAAAATAANATAAIKPSKVTKSTKASQPAKTAAAVKKTTKSAAAKASTAMAPTKSTAAKAISKTGAKTAAAKATGTVPSTSAKTTSKGSASEPIAATAAKSTARTSSKRKAPPPTDSDDEDDLSKDDGNKNMMSRPAKKIRGAAKAAGSKAKAETSSAATKGKQAQTAHSKAAVATNTAASTLTSSMTTRSRAKKPAAEADDASSTTAAETIGKPTPTVTSESTASTSCTIEPTPGLKSAVARPSSKSDGIRKTVTFEETAKENVEATGMRAKPIRKPATGRATRANTQAASTEVTEKTPLSPKKGGPNMPVSRDAESEDELAAPAPAPVPAPVPALENLESSPLSSPLSFLSNMSGFSSPAFRPVSQTPAKDTAKSPVKEDDVSMTATDAESSDTLTTSPIASTPSLPPPPSLSSLSSPARRPPASPFKDAMKSPAKRGEVPFLINTPSVEAVGASSKSTPALFQSPAKRLKLPLTLNEEVAGGSSSQANKSTLLSTPAKRPPSSMKFLGASVPEVEEKQPETQEDAASSTMKELEDIDGSSELSFATPPMHSGRSITKTPDSGAEVQVHEETFHDAVSTVSENAPEEAVVNEPETEPQSTEPASGDCMDCGVLGDEKHLVATEECGSQDTTLNLELTDETEASDFVKAEVAEEVDMASKEETAEVFEEVTPEVMEDIDMPCPEETAEVFKDVTAEAMKEVEMASPEETTEVSGEVIAEDIEMPSPEESTDTSKAVTAETMEEVDMASNEETTEVSKDATAEAMEDIEMPSPEEMTEVSKDVTAEEIDDIKMPCPEESTDTSKEVATEATDKLDMNSSDEASEVSEDVCTKTAEASEKCDVVSPVPSPTTPKSTKRKAESDVEGAKLDSEDESGAKDSSPAPSNSPIFKNKSTEKKMPESLKNAARKAVARLGLAVPRDNSDKWVYPASRSYVKLPIIKQDYSLLDFSDEEESAEEESVAAKAETETTNTIQERGRVDAETQAAMEAYIEADIDAKFAKHSFELTEEDLVEDIEAMQMSSQPVAAEKPKRKLRSTKARLSTINEAGEDSGNESALPIDPALLENKAKASRKRRSESPPPREGKRPCTDAAKAATESNSQGFPAALSSEILKGAIVYVDVHTSEGAEAGKLFTEVLAQMGAQCVRIWPWNPELTPSAMAPEQIGITHVVFKDGARRTLKKVNASRGQVKCVGVGWVLDCEKEQKWLDENIYLVDTDPLIATRSHGHPEDMEPKSVENINGALVTPIKAAFGLARDPQSAAGSSIGRRDSTLWMHSPSEQDDEEDAPSDMDWEPTQIPGFGAMPQTPAPEAVARFAQDVSPGTPSTAGAGSPEHNPLVTQTCPPKQAGQLNMGEALVERDPATDTFRMRLMAARRRSMQFAPKVASPLKKQWK